MNTIETQRLILRPFTLEDLDDLAKILADPDVMEFSTTGPITREATQKFLEEKVLKEYKEWGTSVLAVIHKEDNQLIGFCGINHQILDGNPVAELGYRFAKAYWGQGLATEAAKACMEDVHRHLSIPRIVSIIEKDNTRSIALAERVGLRYEFDSIYKEIPVRIYSYEYPS